MTMPEMPPTAELLHALRFTVAPAIGGAVAGFGGLAAIFWMLGRLAGFDWKPLGPMLAVVGLASGFAVGNYFQPVFPWTPDGKWWHWGAWAVGLSLIVEFIATLPKLPPMVGNLLRGTASGVIAHFVTPPGWQSVDAWWVPAVAAAIAVPWAVMSGVSRTCPGGSVAAAMAVVCGGALVVLLHAGSDGFRDSAIFAFTALASLTVLGWRTGTNAGSAAVAASAPVTILLLMARGLIDTAVPWTAFALVAFAPLTLAVFLHPAMAKFKEYRGAAEVKLLLVGIPVGIAIYQAMDAAPLKFGSDW